jgi:hypothetical protein
MKLSLIRPGSILVLLAISAAACAQVPAPALSSAPNALSWDQVKTRFEASNPALKADADNVDEMRAQEITAHLRPNPQVTTTVDGNGDRSQRRTLASACRDFRDARHQLFA